jgi:hypothetical protein
MKRSHWRVACLVYWQWPAFADVSIEQRMGPRKCTVFSVFISSFLSSDLVSHLLWLVKFLSKWLSVVVSKGVVTGCCRRTVCQSGICCARATDCHGSGVIMWCHHFLSLLIPVFVKVVVGYLVLYWLSSDLASSRALWFWYRPASQSGCRRNCASYHHWSPCRRALSS